MIPIVDYGSIAIVVGNVNAVGSLIEDDDKFGFEVFLSGMSDPIVVGFDTNDEAENARNELVAIIAQFHYAREFGPDFDIEEFMDELEDDYSEIDNDDDDDDIKEH
jgi:hypothetical protein